MTLRHTTHFTVEFGDGDPAQIVFYPNLLRWIDCASRHFDELPVEVREIRVFARRHAADPNRIEAIPPPEHVRRLRG